jgi:hypothetical protein
MTNDERFIYRFNVTTNLVYWAGLFICGGYILYCQF